MSKIQDENIYCFRDKKTFATVLGNVRMMNARNFKSDIHMQEFFEINIIMRGSGKHHLGDNIINVHVGDVFVIPPMLKHGYSDGQDLDVFHILLGNRFIEKNIAELQTIPSFFVLFTAEPLMRANVKSPLHLHLENDEFTAISKLLSESLDYQIFDDTYDSIMRSSYAMMIIAQFCKVYSKKTNEASVTSQNTDELFMNVISRIHEHYYEKLTTNELARAAGLSRNVFIKRFEEICGMTPLEYITDRRLEAARQMLANSNIPISDIASKCGFYDSSHFAKIFKRKKGIYPSVYRKNILTV